MRNHGRFARRIRPSGRGWQYEVKLPKNGRCDRLVALENIRRQPEQKRWLKAKRKKTLRQMVLRDSGKIRFWPELPAVVRRRVDWRW
jgi:hypothetical protein